MTWNDSEESLRAILHTINRQHPDIRITLRISQTINYLDAQIGHVSGDLKTNMARDLKTEPYSLPFVYGHSRHDFFVFQIDEGHDIELFFLLNGFPSNYIAKKVQQCFIEFDAIKLESQYDQTVYDYLRQRVLEYPTTKSKEEVNDLNEPSSTI